MTTFESIFSHLGPTAQPLMVFLQNKEGTALLTTSRYIAGFVSAYAARWGFVLPPYSQHADGGFTLRTATRASFRFPPLRHWEDLTFTEASRRIGGPAYYVGIRDNVTTIPVFRGSQEEITAIREAARPYLLERRRRLPIMATAQGER